MIVVQFDLADFRKKARQMGIFADDQLPYAVSKTINDTMFQDVRPHIIGPTWASAFKVRNSGLPRAAINVEKASKGSWQGGVFDALGKAHLKEHAIGGSITPSRGQLAIPNQQRVKLHARGKTPWAREIRVAPHMARGHLVPSMQVIKGKGIFVGQGGRLHLMYSFASGARLRKRFRFYEDFTRVATAGINARFPANMQRAIATAFG